MGEADATAATAFLLAKWIMRSDPVEDIMAAGLTYQLRRKFPDGVERGISSRWPNFRLIGLMSFSPAPNNWLYITNFWHTPMVVPKVS